eukprot:m.58976 g.58976  ORF g.58976 m.58976 type:complete len:76 (-) comp9437_c0_seq2:2766-2993(-)
MSHQAGLAQSVIGLQGQHVRCTVNADRFRAIEFVSGLNSACATPAVRKVQGTLGADNMTPFPELHLMCQVPILQL